MTLLTLFQPNDGGAPPAPTVISANPAEGTTLGGTAVIITGTNFTGASAVTFGGTAAASFSVSDAATISATTPAHAAGAVDVVVTTGSGSGTGTGIFTYVVVAVAASTAQGSGGGALWPGGGRRRGINFDEMWRHLDAVTEANRQEKQASFERLDNAIAEAVNALSEAAQKTNSPQPRAIIKQAQAVKKQIGKEIVAALAGKPVAAPWFGKAVDLQSEVDGLVRQMQEAQERLIARARELEEDDEDVILLLLDGD